MDDRKVLPFGPSRKSTHRRYRNFRRAMAAQHLPIEAVGRDMMEIAPHGEPAHWIAILQVATRNLSTCSEEEQNRVLYHLIKFLNGRTDRFQLRFTMRPIDPQQALGAIDERLSVLPEHDDRRNWLVDMKEHLTAQVRINNIPQAGLYLIVKTPVSGKGREHEGDAARKLQHLCSLAMADLHNLGVDSRRLSHWEMLCLVWADLNPDLVAVHKKPADTYNLVCMARPEGLHIATTGEYFQQDDPFSSRGQMFWM